MTRPHALRSRISRRLVRHREPTPATTSAAATAKYVSTTANLLLTTELAADKSAFVLATPNKTLPEILHVRLSTGSLVQIRSARYTRRRTRRHSGRATHARRVPARLGRSLSQYRRLTVGPRYDSDQAHTDNPARHNGSPRSFLPRES